MKKIKAILFDMDGVLLDTESVCKICWYRAAEECGLENIQKIFMECVGCNRGDTIRLLSKYFPSEKEAFDFRERTSELFDVIEKEEGLKKMPFVIDCLERLQKSGFRLAVASSTRAIRVHPQLKNAGIFDYFETLTTGDMVTHSKPDPEIYLKSAESLGLKPEECVAIEDSPNGVRSAFSAGIKCIMVPDLIPPDDEMKQKCWKIFSNLKETAEFLCAE
ncbi:HAD family phosphatase [uncultured Treponema sp.]|uniref:HAD family hydrolase n=1 Tax=uncultured Treponema sp. TaxID=162155 RepID=UPI0025EBF1CC|nr:HAD family phosphatase [uncultured Treponema sp.]